MTCRHNWSEETHEGVPSRFCHVCSEWEIEVEYDRALAEVERLRLERDEALAQVARREREHEALLETAQKALAHVEAERDGANAAAERMRDERDYWERRFEYADAHLSEAFNLSPMDNLSSGEAKRIVDLLRIERDEARAEIARLREAMTASMNLCPLECSAETHCGRCALLVRAVDR